MNVGSELLFGKYNHVIQKNMEVFQVMGHDTKVCPTLKVKKDECDRR